jgi:hypothetical protein
MIAWYPEEIVAPAELTSVRVPKGELSQKAWIEALSERVNSLVEKEEDPLEMANEACRKLSLPEVDSANQAGDALVKYNLDLLTNLNVMQKEDLFPAQVNEAKPAASQALKDVNLASWVELALSQVSVSSLD